MPRRRNNGAFEGGRKLHQSPFVTNSISEEDVINLAEVFTSVDRDIIYSVLLECEGDVHLATDKLFEILGGSTQRVFKEENDLALIACSLLSNDSHEIKTNIVDDVPDGIDLKGFYNSATEQGTIEPSLSLSNDLNRGNASSVSVETSLNINHLQSTSAHSEEKTERKDRLVSSIRGSFHQQKFHPENLSLSEASGSSYSKGNLNKVMLVNSSNMHEVTDVQPGKLPIASQNLTSFNDTADKKLTNLDLNAYEGSGKLSDQSSLLNPSGLTRTNEAWLTYYKTPDSPSDDDDFISGEYQPISMEELERKTFGHTSGSLKSDAVNQIQPLQGLKGEKNEKTSVLNTNAEKKENSFNVNSEKERKTKKKKKKSKEGKNPVRKSSAMADSPAEVQCNGLETHSNERSSPRSSQSISSDHSSSSRDNTEGCDGIKEHKSTHLSPNAAEFIPRPLVLGQSMPLSRSTATSAQSTEPPKPLKPLPFTCIVKPKNRKQKKGRNNPANEVTNNLDEVNDSQLLKGQTPPAKDFSFHESASSNQKVFDPMDPLGWNDITEVFENNLSNPKPQRSTNMKKTSNFHLSKPSTASSALQFNNQSENIPVTHYINSSPWPVTSDNGSASSPASPSSLGKYGVMYSPSDSAPRNMKQKIDISGSSFQIPAENVMRNKPNIQDVTSPKGRMLYKYIVEKQPVVFILRGLPGSGKSYMANELVKESRKLGGEAVILSSDDYFMKGNQYCYNKNEIGSAHDWNKKRALACIKAGTSPIIIDNTNTEMWELLPYAVMALENKYDVQLLEPETPWKSRVAELAQKNRHGVPKEHIRRMEERYQKITLTELFKQANQSIAARGSLVITPISTTRPNAQPSVKENKFQGGQQDSVSNQSLFTSSGSEKVRNVEKPSNAASAKQDFGFSDWASDQPLEQRQKVRGEHWDKSTEVGHTKMEVTQNEKILPITDKLKSSNMDGLVNSDTDDTQSNDSLELPETSKNIQTGGLILNKFLSVKAVTSKLNSSCSTVDSFKTTFSGNDSFHSARMGNSDLETDGSEEQDVEQEFVGDLAEEVIGINNLSLLDTEVGKEKDDAWPDTPATVVESAPFSVETKSKDLFDLSQDSMKSKDEAKKEGDVEILQQLNNLSLNQKDDPIGHQDVEADRIGQQSNLLMVDQFLNSSITTPNLSVNPKADSSSKTGKIEHDDFHGSLSEPVTDKSFPAPLVEYSDSISEDSDNASRGSQGGERKVEETAIKVDDQKTVFSKNSATILNTDCSDKEEYSKENILYAEQTDKVETGRKNRNEVTAHRLDSDTSDDTPASNSPNASSREPSPPVNTSVKALTASAKKKKKKRIRKGRARDPFLEDSVKAKSKNTENWKTMLDQHMEETNISVSFPQVEKVVQTAGVSQSAQCDSYYFSLVHKLNSQAFNNLQPVDFSSNEEKVMISSSNKAISLDCDASLVPRRGDTSDKSTVTDEMLDQDKVDLETLHNCFPEYTRKQLEELMKICQNDLEWVTTHLLDSPALFDIEEDDREKEENSAATECNSAASDCSVKSLASLCSSVVRDTIKIDEDDLEMQVIQAGQTRLQSIEHFSLSRFHSSQDYWPDNFDLGNFDGTVTQEECWDWVPQKPPTPDYRATQPNFMISPSSKPRLYATEPKSPSKDFLTTIMRDNQFTLSPIKDRGEFFSSNSPVRRPSSIDDIVQGDTHVNQTISQYQPTVPTELIRCLESLYGPLNVQCGEEGFILDDKTARKIHKCLKLQAQKKTVVDPGKQVEEDEALARQLQEEEHRGQGYSKQQSGSVGGGSSNVSGWTNQMPTWMSQGHSIQQGTANAYSLDNCTLPGQMRQFYPENQTAPNVLQSKQNTVSGTLDMLRGTKGKLRKKPRKFQPRMPVAHASAWQGVKKRSTTDSFQSIMEEELAQEERNKEEVRISEMYGDTNALATRIKRQELIGMFPSLGPQVLEEVFRSTGYSKDMTVKMLTEIYSIAPAPMSKEKEEEIIEKARQKSKTDFYSVPVDPQEFFENLEKKGSDLTYDDLRNEAQFYRRLANDCREQANRYQADGMQGAALFYRQQIKKYKEEEHAANHRAAQFLYQKGSERLEKENTLDLHFFHLDEAILAVNSAISEKEEAFKIRRDKKDSYLNIVTGRGRNSKDGVPKLKPAIMNHLRDRCLRFEEKTAGMLKVYLGSRINREI